MHDNLKETIYHATFFNPLQVRLDKQAEALKLLGAGDFVSSDPGDEVESILSKTW